MSSIKTYRIIAAWGAQDSSLVRIYRAKSEENAIKRFLKDGWCSRETITEVIVLTKEMEEAEQEQIALDYKLSCLKEERKDIRENILDLLERDEEFIKEIAKLQGFKI